LPEPKRTDISVRAERAVLLGVQLPGDRDDSVGELVSLAHTAGAKVVGCLVQKRTVPDSTFMIGRGKAQELAAICAELKADIIICGFDLAPSQLRNLEETTNTKVVDRTELILDIFATHARTRQARIQVELAQLEYLRPRLRRMWTHLSRIEGGIGTRGPGEQQLEVDRRAIANRIAHLKTALRRIERRKERQVSSRKDELTVSMVGYTNAGKSSLMNRLTGAGVYVNDRLFATLDTKTHVCNLGDNRKILLSDTVGFIKHLPHDLVASFHATLEEVRRARLLLHVADISSEDFWEQVEAVNAVLAELGCADKPIIMVLNKIDLLDREPDPALLSKRLGNFVLVSALTGRGLDDLKETLRKFADDLEVEATVTADPGDAELFSFLSQKGRVLRTSLADGQAKFAVRLEPKYLGKLRKLGVQVTLKGSGE